MKLDRLLGILTVLLQKDSATAPELAEKFEVSRRTIGRDIDALCMAGIPVVARQGSGGGLSIAEGFKLDKSILTTEALLCLTVGSIELNLTSYHKKQLTEKIKSINRAILNKHFIEFDYFYDKGTCRRRIEPYFVIFQWSSWYVFGFCLERQDFRLFKLQRLWDFHCCDERFEPREIPPDKRDFNATFKDDIKLTALFDPSAKYQLIENYGLNCFTETDEGLLFKFGFTNRDYLVSWLLSFGGNVKVLEPDYIAEDLKAAAEKILENYK
ncbi:MAG: YafY family transcriptional regulator [Oscillospiraceae bacterium]|nr:YafY family transcriptional regulator [Oscillospiraceae bacterium]